MFNIAVINILFETYFSNVKKKKESFSSFYSQSIARAAQLILHTVEIYFCVFTRARLSCFAEQLIDHTPDIPKTRLLCPFEGYPRRIILSAPGTKVFDRLLQALPCLQV